MVVFQVSAFNNNIFGRVSSLSVVLKGIPLPEVPQQSIFNDGKEVKLRWNQPNPPIENVVYGIYYGTTLDELFESKCRRYFVERKMKIRKQQ